MLARLRCSLASQAVDATGLLCTRPKPCSIDSAHHSMSLLCPPNMMISDLGVVTWPAGRRRAGSCGEAKEAGEARSGLQSCIALHYIALHCISLHCTGRHPCAASAASASAPPVDRRFRTRPAGRPAGPAGLAAEHAEHTNLSRSGSFRPKFLKIEGWRAVGSVSGEGGGGSAGASQRVRTRGWGAKQGFTAPNKLKPSLKWEHNSLQVAYPAFQGSACSRASGRACPGRPRSWG